MRSRAFLAVPGSRIGAVALVSLASAPLFLLAHQTRMAETAADLSFGLLVIAVLRRLVVELRQESATGRAAAPQGGPRPRTPRT